MRLSLSSCKWNNAIRLLQRQGRCQPHQPTSTERRKFLLRLSSSSPCSNCVSCRPLSSAAPTFPGASARTTADAYGYQHQQQRQKQKQKQRRRQEQHSVLSSRPSAYSFSLPLSSSLYNSSIAHTTSNAMNEQIRHYRYAKSDNSAKLRALRNKNDKNKAESIRKDDIERSIDYRYRHRDSFSSTASPIPSSPSHQVQTSLSSLLLDYDYDDRMNNEKKDSRDEDYDDDDDDDGDDMVIMDVKRTDDIKSLWGDAAFQAEKERSKRRQQQQLQQKQQKKMEKQSNKKMNKNHNEHNRKGKRNNNRNIANESKDNNLTRNPSNNSVAFKPLFAEIDEIMGKRSALVSTKKKNNNSNNSNLNDAFTTSINSLFDGMVIDKQQTRNDSHGTARVTTESDGGSDSDKSGNETKKTSIFDTFPIIDKRKNDKENVNKFDNYCYEQYETMMNEIVHSDRFRKKGMKKPCEDEMLQPVIDWLLKDERFIPYDYNILTEAVENGIALSQNESENKKDTPSPSNGKKRKSFRDAVTKEGSQSQQFLAQLEQQRQHFLEKSGFTSEQHDNAARAFNILSSNCAKIGSTSSLSVAWEKMKEGGIIPNVGAMSAYLYVSGMMTASGLFRISSLNEPSHPTAASTTFRGKNNNHLSSVLSILGTSNNLEGSDDNNDNAKVNDAGSKHSSHRIDLPTEMAIFHDLLFEPTEKSMTLRVKRLVSQGNAAEAEDLLNSIPSIKDDARLRTYLPVLKLYCEQRNLNSALSLFKRMRNEPSVRLEPENYVLLISAMAENGYFRSDKSAKKVECALELGYNNTSGPELFDELLSEMSDDILEISSASARRLYNAIVEGFKNEEENDKEQNNKLKPLNTLGGLVTDNDKARPDELIASRVAVGTTNGICPRSGVKLQLINLESDHRRQLHKSLLQLSNSRFEEFSNYNGSEPDNYASKHLNSYAQWLDSREGKPFTAIIDGANVAYYMQNFEGGSFNFHQIKFMVEALEDMNENPLVVLPYKYCSPKFQETSTRRLHIVKKDEKKILDDLIKKGQLYRVPARCLDDYYWMLASVSDQTKSRNGIDLDISIENKEGRWPGARPMLISNDQMRDHKLGLLEPRLFRRWYSCYIVNYNFTAFVGKESVDREIGFSTADVFSREIQSNNTDSGRVWHIPVNDWKLDDRFCVRIPKM